MQTDAPLFTEQNRKQSDASFTQLALLPFVLCEIIGQSVEGQNHSSWFAALALGGGRLVFDIKYSK